MADPRMCLDGGVVHGKVGLERALHVDHLLQRGGDDLVLGVLRRVEDHVVGALTVKRAAEAEAVKVQARRLRDAALHVLADVLRHQIRLVARVVGPGEVVREELAEHPGLVVGRLVVGKDVAREVEEHDLVGGPHLGDAHHLRDVRPRLEGGRLTPVGGVEIADARRIDATVARGIRRRRIRLALAVAPPALGPKRLEPTLDRGLVQGSPT